MYVPVVKPNGWYINGKLISSRISPKTHYFVDKKNSIRAYTVKPVCNDHLYTKIYYLWFIQ